VPALDDDGTILTQSLAIIEYRKRRMRPRRCCRRCAGRARVRALALAIAATPTR
jgi:glutathione S-transferase